MTDPATLDDADPTRFRDYQSGLLPPWLADPVGDAWARSFGTMKDTIAEGATAAVESHILSLCADDALLYHGRDSNIDRMPSESAASYRARLLARWATWQTCASDKALDLAFAPLGFTVHIVRNNQWDWDGHPGNVTYYWARMWVVVDQPSGATTGDAWGSSFAWGASHWGVNGIDDDHVAQLRKQTLKWTDSSVLIPKIIVRISGDLWGDSFAWGSSAWGGDCAMLEGG